MMEYILNNTVLQSLVVMVSQILFLFFRTLNIRYIAERSVIKAVISGNCIGILWLITVALGAKALLDGNIMVVIAQLVGGSIGTYIGIKTRY
jgi:hypothetical protein